MKASNLVKGPEVRFLCFNSEEGISSMFVLSEKSFTQKKLFAKMFVKGSHYEVVRMSDGWFCLKL